MLTSVIYTVAESVLNLDLPPCTLSRDDNMLFKCALDLRVAQCLAPIFLLSHVENTIVDCRIKVSRDPRRQQGRGC